MSHSVCVIQYDSYWNDVLRNSKKFAWISLWNGLASILSLIMKKNLFGKKSQTITISGLFGVSLTFPDFPTLFMTFPNFDWLSQSYKMTYSIGLPSIFKRIFDSVCEHNRQSNYWLQFNLYHGEIFRCGTQTRIHCRTFRIRSKLYFRPKCFFVILRQNCCPK